MLDYGNWFLCYLGLAAWQDGRRKRISCLLLVTGAVLGMGIRIMQMEGKADWISCAFSLLPGIVVLLAGKLSGGRIGEGDGFLLLVTGLWVGGEACVGILILASFLCSAFCALLLMCRKAGRETEIPFIPFLFAAGMLYHWMELTGGKV